MTLHDITINVLRKEAFKWAILGEKHDCICSPFVVFVYAENNNNNNKTLICPNLNSLGLELEFEFHHAIMSMGASEVANASCNWQLEITE